MTSPSEWVLDAAPPPPAARIAYGPDPLQFGALYLPPGPGPHPLALALHGGFWKAKYDLGHLGHACAALAAEGIATFNVEFRRTGHPGGGYPGTLEDVRLALSAVPTLAAHGVRTDRLVVFGHSAGGQLALWLAGEQRHFIGAQSIVKGVVSLAGVTDLARGAALKLGDGAVERFMGAPADAAPDDYGRASPLSRLPLQVPQVLIHGEDDDTVPFTFSVDYVERARALEDDARLVPLSATGHMELVDPRSAAWPTVVAALRDLSP